MIPNKVRLAIVLFGGLIVQAAVAPVFAVGGRVVDVMLLLAITGGALAGPDEGVVIGFFAGLGTDLLVQTPFGMWALIGCLIAYVSGVAFTGFFDGGRILRVMTVGTALAIGTATFVLVGRLIGQEFLADIALIPVLVVVCVGGMILSPVAFRAMAWALGMDRLPWATTR